MQDKTKKKKQRKEIKLSDLKPPQDPKGGYHASRPRPATAALIARKHCRKATALPEHPPT